MKLREINYLVTARTTHAECVPVFWTCFREQAISKAHNVKTGYANDAAQRLKLPTGAVVSVNIIDLVNGSPARMDELKPRSAREELLESAIKAMIAPDRAPGYVARATHKIRRRIAGINHIFRRRQC